MRRSGPTICNCTVSMPFGAMICGTTPFATNSSTTSICSANN